MQNTLKNKPLKGFKFILAAGVLTGTVGLWNMFANQAVKNSQNQATANSQTVPPVPTQSSASVSQTTTETQSLRSVAAPTQNSAAPAQPVIQQVVVNQGTSGSAGTVSSSPVVPVTSTGSSR